MLVGKTGNISIEDGRGVGIEIEPKVGLEIDAGWESPESAPGRLTRLFELPLVALVPERLTALSDVQSILEEASAFATPVLIVSPGCAGDALKTVVMNDAKGVVAGAAMRISRMASEAIDNMDDLAALTGATIADANAGRDCRKWDPDWFGGAQTVELREQSTVFVGFDTDEAGDRIMARVSELQGRRSGAGEYDADVLDRRIAKLTGGFCLLKVGGVGDVDRRERRGRLEDALSATQTALRTGLKPGGGMAYFALSCLLDSPPDPDRYDPAYKDGWDILQRALRAPLRTIASNAGDKPDVVEDRVMQVESDQWEEDFFWWGWDARSHTVRNMWRTEPIVAEPAGQIQTIIEAAVSVASTLLTVETAITRD